MVLVLFVVLSLSASSRLWYQGGKTDIVSGPHTVKEKTSEKKEPKSLSQFSPIRTVVSSFRYEK